MILGAMIAAAIVTDGSNSLPEVARRSPSQEGFVENRGQFDSRVRFVLRKPGLTFWVTQEGATMDFHRTRLDRQLGQDTLDVSYRGERDGHVVRVQFEGATGAATAEGIGPMSGVSHRYGPGYAVTGVRSFEGALVRNVVEGVDVRYYLDADSPRYDLIVKPGAKVSDLSLRYEGAQSIRVAPNGSLVYRTSLGEVAEENLLAYQRRAGRLEPVPAKFVVEGNRVRFQVANYDSSQELVIDPQVVVRGSYFGGSNVDQIRRVEVGQNDDVFVMGTTASTADDGFPTTLGAYSREIQGISDVFVARFDTRPMTLPQAHPAYRLLYSTYISTPDDGPIEVTDLTQSGAMSAHRSGALAFGFTTTTDGLPVSGAGAGVNKPAFAPNLNGGSDAYLGVLSAEGKLYAATYYGGISDDLIFDLVLTDDSRIVAVGETRSPDLPVIAGGQDALAGKSDMMVGQFGFDLTSAAFSTYLGGEREDSARGVAVSGRKIAIAGSTSSSNFPGTSRGWDQVLGSGKPGNDFDGVVALYTSLGPVASASYVGTDHNRERLNCVAFSTNGDVYAGGVIRGRENVAVPGGDVVPLTTADAWDSTLRAGNREGYIIRLNENLSRRVAATYLGGSGNDEVYAIAVNANGRVSAAGITDDGASFPVTEDALPNEVGGVDAFITRLNNGFTVASHSTTVGSVSDDLIFDIAIANDLDNVLVVGATSDAGYRLENAYDSTFNGGIDGLMVEVAYYRDPLRLIVVPGAPGVAHAGVFLNIGATSATATGAPGPGAWVSITSSDPSLAMPAGSHLLIPPGQLRGSMKVFLKPVMAPTTVQLRATYSGTTRTANLKLNP